MSQYGPSSGFHQQQQPQHHNQSSGTVAKSAWDDLASVATLAAGGESPSSMGVSASKSSGPLAAAGLAASVYNSLINGGMVSGIGGPMGSSAYASLPHSLRQAAISPLPWQEAAAAARIPGPPPPPSIAHHQPPTWMSAAYPPQQSPGQHLASSQGTTNLPHANFFGSAGGPGYPSAADYAIGSPWPTKFASSQQGSPTASAGSGTEFRYQHQTSATQNFSALGSLEPHQQQSQRHNGLVSPISNGSSAVLGSTLSPNHSAAYRISVPLNLGTTSSHLGTASARSSFYRGLEAPLSQHQQHVASVHSSAFNTRAQTSPVQQQQNIFTVDITAAPKNSSTTTALLDEQRSQLRQQQQHSLDGTTNTGKSDRRGSRVDLSELEIAKTMLTIQTSSATSTGNTAGAEPARVSAYNECEYQQISPAESFEGTIGNDRKEAEQQRRQPMSDSDALSPPRVKQRRLSSPCSATCGISGSSSSSCSGNDTHADDVISSKNQCIVRRNSSPSSSCSVKNGENSPKLRVLDPEKFEGSNNAIVDCGTVGMENDDGSIESKPFKHSPKYEPGELADEELNKQENLDSDAIVVNAAKYSDDGSSPAAASSSSTCSSSTSTKGALSPSPTNHLQVIEEDDDASAPTTSSIVNIAVPPFNVTVAADRVTTATRTEKSARKFSPSVSSYPKPVNKAATKDSTASNNHQHQFKCQQCNFTCAQKFHFNSHMNTHTDRKCTKCDYTSRTEGRLKKHMNDAHSPDSPDLADRLAIENANVSRESFSSNAEQFSLPSPDGSLSDRDDSTSLNVQQHQSHRVGSSSTSGPAHSTTASRPSTSSKPKRYKCKQCQFVSPSKDVFWEHQRSHIKPDRLLQCQHCPFVTEYKHHMEYHMRNHSNVKPYKCSKCNYKCVNKSMLNSHMKSHSSIYQYRCLDCSYETKYCHSLKQHLRKHKHRPGKMVNQEGVEEDIDLDIYGNRRGPRLRRKKMGGAGAGSANVVSGSAPIRDVPCSATAPSSSHCSPTSNIMGNLRTETPNSPSLVDFYHNSATAAAAAAAMLASNSMPSVGPMGVQLPTVSPSRLFAMAPALTASTLNLNDLAVESFKQFMENTTKNFTNVTSAECAAAAAAAYDFNNLQQQLLHHHQPRSVLAGASTSSNSSTPNNDAYMFDATPPKHESRSRSGSFVVASSSSSVTTGGPLSATPVVPSPSAPQASSLTTLLVQDQSSSSPVRERSRGDSQSPASLSGGKMSSDDGNPVATATDQSASASHQSGTGSNNNNRRRKGKAYKLDTIALRLQGRTSPPPAPHQQTSIASVGPPPVPSTSLLLPCSNRKSGSEATFTAVTIEKTTTEYVAPIAQCSTASANGSPARADPFNNNVRIAAGGGSRRQSMPSSAYRSGSGYADTHSPANSCISGTTTDNHRERQSLSGGETGSTLIGQGAGPTPPSSTNSRAPPSALVGGATTAAAADLSTSNAYFCSHCRMWFEQQVKYLIHKGYHSKDDPFKCNICGYNAVGDDMKFYLHLLQASHEEQCV